jgi:hypothetical protein
MPERLAVFSDYQNVRLVAHELYRPPGTPVHDSVVDPVRVAELIAAKRKVNE